MDTTAAEVLRPRLLERLDRAPAGALVLLVAGAGSGKTTLLRQWRRGVRPVALVEPAGGVGVDGRGFVGAALTAVRAVVAAPGEPDDDLDLLLALAGRHGVSLALDDVDRLGPATREHLRALVARWPATGTLVLSGRTRPDVPLVRAHVGAPLRVVRGHELAFDDDELRRSGAPDRTAPDVDALRRRTGGWPAGVRALAGGVDGPPADGLDAHLRREVLAGFDDDELDLLGHLAALAPAPLRVLDVAQRRDDTADAVRSLVDRGLPMVDLPEHPDGPEPLVVPELLATHLLDRLRRRDPARVDAVVDLAVQAAEAAGEAGYAFELLGRHRRHDAQRALPYRHLGALVLGGRSDEVTAWLGRFDPATVEADPVLLLPAVAAALPVHEDHVRDLLAPHAADRATVLPDGLTPAAAIPRLLAALGLGAASTVDPGGHGSWRQVWGLTRAWDLYAADHPEPADRVLAAIEGDAAPYPLALAVGRAKRSIIALELGRPARAALLLQAAQEVVERAGLDDDPRSATVHVAATALARHHRDLDLAERHAVATRAHLAALGDGAMLDRITALLGLAHLAVDRAAPAVDLDAHLLPIRALLGRWRQAPRLERQVAELAGRRGGREPVGPGLRITAAERRVLRFLPSHHTLPRIAQELGVSYSTVKTQCLSLYRKLGVRTRADAVVRAGQLGLLDAAP